jgi:hypothetical protein
LEEFFDHRIRLLYSHDDLFVMPEGFYDLEHVLPDDSKATGPDTRHVEWRRSKHVEETIDALLRAHKGLE